MNTSLQTLAEATLAVVQLPTNFAIHGRRSSYGHAGLRPSGFSMRPYFPQSGAVYNDWAWKPSIDVRIALNEGNRKCTTVAFNEYLATLSGAERQRILAAKHAFESGHSEKLQSLQQVFDDQMEGWKDDGGRLDRGANIGLSHKGWRAAHEASGSA